MSQLPVDCLNYILEYLKDDVKALHSCILVNHLWCEISVRIFWIEIRNYYTIIACLPNDSKEILCKIGFNNLISTLKPPIFNYASFCKILSIDKVHYKIGELLKNQKSTLLQNIYNNIHLVMQEICKMLMNQTSSLKSLTFLHPSITNFIPFVYYPGANDCLKNLSELRCNSNISSEFFHQLSKTCHNIILLEIIIDRNISNGLADLISIQKNLKYVSITQYSNLKDTLPSLITKLPNILIKLNLTSANFISLLFITKFINLQELILSFDYEGQFKDFEKFQYAIFPQLQVLRIRRVCPRDELLINFLENNGKNLKEIYIGGIGSCNENSLHLTIAKFCPNLKKLCIGFKNNKLETLKMISDNCQYLESIKILCGGYYSSEKEALKAVAKYSQNITELILYHLFSKQLRSFPEELESFFKSWTSHVPLKSISLVVVTNYICESSLDKYDENMEVIKKYIKLGVIKKFKVTDFDDEEYN
ncbi:unnamed protein product [Rhizophagus irregularis]|nr:unnamed protein product [Rhizophagus irregularis]CAB5389367.1 unnamed protein product [Rhizophagus irregularis]